VRPPADHRDHSPSLLGSSEQYGAGAVRLVPGTGDGGSDVDGPQRAGMSVEVLQQIDPAMQSYVHERGFAGISVVVARHGQIVFDGQYGQRDIEAALPMASDTIFRIYSMTKPVVAAGVMSLVDDGRLALTDAVARYLPAFGRVRVLAADGALEDVARPITVRDLLTHTCGLTNELQDTPVAARYRQARLHHDASRSLADLIDVVAELPLAFQPGATWHYGMGLDVAARLIEVVADQPLGAFLADRIFGPLGMPDTAFEVPAAERDRLATMYGLPDVFAAGLTLGAIAEAAAAGANDRVDVSATYPVDRPDVFARGGFGLFSTVGDYLRFAQMLVNGGVLDGTRVLAVGTVASMYRNHLPTALLPFELFGVADVGRGFGLGSSVMMDVAAAGGWGSVGEHGWSGAATTTFWVDPEQDLTGVVMAQYMLATAAPAQDVRELVHRAIVG
jgi:CubicO group peptidase (beta-lactamase class C family)